MVRVAINGLGRIGRATFKIIMENPGLELVAVNDIGPAENLVYLLKYDSVYGRYERHVALDGDAIVLDGEKRIEVLAEKDPARLPWKELGVELVFECSGIFTREEDLRKHREAGAEKVILSAPVKGGNIPTIIPGINKVSPDDKIISCASCTTNCISTVLEILGRRIGIKKAIMSTVHAYTSSQSIVDSPNKKMERGRAAALSFVPTSTGAAKATSDVLPQFQNTFDGVAIRGPVPAGSIADITLLTVKETSEEEVNGILEEEAGSDRYKGIFGATRDNLVSSDIIKDSRASIADLSMTRVVDGDLVKVMSWYDNEWGYVNQMVRAGMMMAGQPEPAEV